MRRVQYVVVDGGSTDGTLEVIRECSDRIDNWISEPDLGIPNAFNKGIGLASGQIIGFLNAGDWYEPEALTLLEDAYKAHPEIDVFCGAIQFWECGSPSILCNSDPSRIETETSIYHPTVFIKKSAYLQYGVYNEEYRYAMDYELLLRFKRKGAKFFNIGKTLANMPLDGISYTHWYEGLKEVKKARSKYFSPANVAFYHLRAVGMNLAARGLKSIGLRGVYQSYWKFHNKQMSKNRQEGV